MTFLRAVFLGLLVALSITQSATAKALKADPSLVWQFSRHKDDAAKIDAVQLIYGIPETDAVEAMASCDTANAGKVVLNLSANVTAPDKANVSVRIFGQTMNAAAIIPESGEGLAGFGVTVPLNDPLLAKLASKPSLTYALKVGGDRTIPLSKGKGPIKKFIEACKRFAKQN